MASYVHVENILLFILLATTCPTPFSLIADGCFLVVHNTRDWRSWGDAYAFCQVYSGELASPWRLSQLQDYLIQHYCKHIRIHVPLNKNFWHATTHIQLINVLLFIYKSECHPLNLPKPSVCFLW